MAVLNGIRHHDEAVQQETVLEQFVLCSNKTGRVVTFPEQYGCVPALVGSDNNPVLLYNIVEEIENIVDPADLQKQFPTLSYTQIVGALMFLRKIAQFNTRNLDLDEVEDNAIEKSAGFQELMTQSLKSGEARVVQSAK